MIAALLCFMFALYYYGTAPGYLDHVEPGLSLLSWGLINGKPLYTLPDSLNYSINTSHVMKPQRIIIVFTIFINTFAQVFC